MLNSAVAESLKQYADELEAADDFQTALRELIKRTIKDHKRIIFNGNGYDDEWIKEATEKRGLLNLKTTPDCMPKLLDKKNVDMLTSHKVFSKAELESRFEIMLDNYTKTVTIEALTMVDMAKKQILPAIETYVAELAKTASAKIAVAPELACKYEKGLITKLSSLTDTIADRTKSLEDSLISLKAIDSVPEAANYIRDEIIPKMGELRIAVDEAETMTSEKDWPLPSYGDLLFSVR